MQSRKLSVFGGVFLTVAMLVAGPLMPIASAATLSVSATGCPTTGTQYGVYPGCTIAATGGTAPYKYSWSTDESYSSLVPGLTLSATTGQISGTLYGQGMYTMDFIVTDATGATANTQLTIDINGDNTLGGCQVFPSDSIFHTNISNLPVDTSPAAAIPAAYQSATIKPFFGDGYANEPNGIPFIRVPWNQPMSTVATTLYQSYFTSAPIPSYAPVEGTSNGVGAAGGDGHVLVLQTAGNGNPCKLYEMWQGSSTGPTSWTDSSNAEWLNLSSYALTPQGDGTTDAAGLPVLPLLVNYDEDASGVITHPIRFTLNNTLNYWVWPATESAGVGSCKGSNGSGISTESLISQSAPPASCNTSAPMGEIYRLKASVATPSACAGDPQALPIITAFRNYGIILADNGISGGLIGTPDARWSNDQLSCLSNLTLSDFEPVNVSSLMVNSDSAQTTLSGSGTTTTPTSTPTSTPVTSDTTPPTVSITSPSAGVSISGTATVAASASDNVGVTSVAFYLDGTLLGTDTTAPYTFSLNTGSIANGSHTLLAKAYDAAGNVGTSASVSITISNPVTDTIPPSIPTGLTVGTVTTSTVALSWMASTDNVGVAGYNVYRKGTKVGTSVGASYKDTGLSASTTYSYTVSAYDAAGNTSGQSTSVSATTIAGTSTSSTPPVTTTSTPVTPTTTPTSSIPTGPAGYTFCSYEYGTCSFSGTMSVAYGIGSSFYYLTLKNGTACGNAVFGDPSVGADKACFIEAVATTTLPTTPTSTPSSTSVTPPTTPSSTPTSTPGVFQIGARVRTTARLKVRSSYGRDNDRNIRGAQPAGQTGTIVGGPVTLDGYIWWKVNYDSGVSGWSAQDWLTIIPATGQSTSTVAQQEPTTTDQSSVADNASPATIAQMASIMQQFQSLLKAWQNAGL